MVCPKCGTDLPQVSSSCPYCGFNTLTGKKSGKERKSSVSPNLIFGILLGLAALLFLMVIIAVFFQNSAAPAATASAAHSEAPVPSESPTASFWFSPSALPAQSEMPSEEQTPSTGQAHANELLAYFNEIALKSEYGDADSGRVRRWEQPIKVQIKGKYTKDDYHMLVSFIDKLKNLKCLPDIQIVDTGGNYMVYFVPLKKMPDVVPGYVEGNWGYVSLAWNGTCQIENGVMGVSTDVTNQVQRNHVILEEFTQGLGLLNDSPKYPDSIFQIEWSEVQTLTDMDYEIVKMLYSPALQAGMQQEEADESLRQWLKLQPDAGTEQ